LQAGLMGGGGEVLVLDMGEPVRIVDLARHLIRLSGADPDAIGIVFTGLRPGEKLYEEPLAAEETPLATPHPKLFIAQARANGADAIDQMIAWLERDRVASDADVRSWLKAWIAEYAPPGELPRAAVAVQRLVARLGLQVDPELCHRRHDGLEADGIHAARVRALRRRALAASHPGDLALEERALIATGKRIDADRAIGHAAPEGSRAGERHRPGTEQSHGWRADDAAEVRDTGVRGDQD